MAQYLRQVNAVARDESVKRLQAWAATRRCVAAARSWRGADWKPHLPVWCPLCPGPTGVAAPKGVQCCLVAISGNPAPGISLQNKESRAVFLIHQGPTPDLSCALRLAWQLVLDSSRLWPWLMGEEFPRFRLSSVVGDPGLGRVIRLRRAISSFDSRSFPSCSIPCFLGHETGCPHAFYTRPPYRAHEAIIHPSPSDASHTGAHRVQRPPPSFSHAILPRFCHPLHDLFITHPPATRLGVEALVSPLGPLFSYYPAFLPYSHSEAIQLGCHPGPLTHPPLARTHPDAHCAIHLS